MKLFKKMMAAVMIGVMSLTMLVGCSGNTPITPDTPMPSDPDAKSAYYMLAGACKQNGLKMPTYNEELSAIAEEYLDTYIAKNVDKSITNTVFNSNNKATDAKLATLTTLTVLYPSANNAPKKNVGAFQNLAIQGGERTILQSAIVDWGCNYVGIAAKEASDGTKYMALVYVKAEAASAQPAGE